MKYFAILVTCSIGVAIAAEQPMRDAATHEDLVVPFRKAMQEDPMRKQAPAKGKAEDPSVVNRPKSLINESDIICFNGAVTLVPKRAILMIPKNVESRFKYVAGATLMNWPEFYAANRGWISTVEVTREQAEGTAPIAETIQKKITESGNLVVATYKAGPISVLPLKTEAKAPQS